MKAPIKVVVIRFVWKIQDFKVLRYYGLTTEGARRVIKRNIARDDCFEIHVYGADHTHYFLSGVNYIVPDSYDYSQCSDRHDIVDDILFDMKDADDDLPF